jgi:anhydro-N-acetylmuramic acid kinase
MGLYLGLMSGTSMDAIDAAVVDFDVSPLRVVAAHATPLPPELKVRLTALIDAPAEVTLDSIGVLDVELGRAFAHSALALLHSHRIPRTHIAAIGSHGQTLRHRATGPAPFSWQIGDPNVIAELTGVTVVADFRRRDVAAGGQGAPLVPVFHDQVFRSPAQPRVIANIGGIANITVLRGSDPVLGFDTGPGNRLVDAWCRRHTGRDFDAGGQWARTGKIDAALLARLMSEPYLREKPPKSTGRELFNLSWLDAHLGKLDTGPGAKPDLARAADVQATLLEFTVESLAGAVRAFAPDAGTYVCGGGAQNVFLMERLHQRLAPQSVQTTAALGLDPDYVEATAFAWFAKRTLEGHPSNLPSVTGASGLRTLGAVYAAR